MLCVVISVRAFDMRMRYSWRLRRSLTTRSLTTWFFSAKSIELVFNTDSVCQNILPGEGLSLWRCSLVKKGYVSLLNNPHFCLGCTWYRGNSKHLPRPSIFRKPHGSFLNLLYSFFSFEYSFITPFLSHFFHFFWKRKPGLVDLLYSVKDEKFEKC